MAEEKKGINPLTTGVAGAVIGAAAAAAAIALSDEKNRQKAEKILTDMQKEGNKIFKTIIQMAMELKDKGEKALSRAAEEEPKKLNNKKKGSG